MLVVVIVVVVIVVVLLLLLKVFSVERVEGGGFLAKAGDAYLPLSLHLPLPPI